MSYKHLSLEERHYIELSLKEGVSQNKISETLGRYQSSITREIKRNTGKRGYRHNQANHFAIERHKNKKKSVKLTAEIKEQLNIYIKKDWSPEQIVGRLKLEGGLSLHAFLQKFLPYVTMKLSISIF